MMLMTVKEWVAPVFATPQASQRRSAREYRQLAIYPKMDKVVLELVNVDEATARGAPFSYGENSARHELSWEEFEREDVLLERLANERACVYKRMVELARLLCAERENLQRLYRTLASMPATAA